MFYPSNTFVLINAAYKQFLQILTVLEGLGTTAFLMRKKKRILEKTGDAGNGGKLSRCIQGDATPIKLGACAAVEKTSTCLWLCCLVGVSLLSLLTRLYNLHLPASVWLVWIF